MWHTIVHCLSYHYADSGFDHRRSQPIGIRDIVAACLFLLLSFHRNVFVKDAWRCSRSRSASCSSRRVPCARIAGKEHIAAADPWLVYLIPSGPHPILAHTTTSTVDTRLAVLRWGLLPAYSFDPNCRCTRTARRNILSAFLIFATVMACSVLHSSLPLRPRPLDLPDRLSGCLRDVPFLQQLCAVR